MFRISKVLEQKRALTAIVLLACLCACSLCLTLLCSCSQPSTGDNNGIYEFKSIDTSELNMNGVEYETPKSGEQAILVDEADNAENPAPVDDEQLPPAGIPIDISPTQETLFPPQFESVSDISSDTSGPPYTIPTKPLMPISSVPALLHTQTYAIDDSHANDGYVSVGVIAKTRAKCVVRCDSDSVHYDVPIDGTPTYIPLHRGGGNYTIMLMQNTTANRYVELERKNVFSECDEFAPFLRPNVMCDYSQSSQCVAKAKELASNCANQGDVLASVYTFITENVQYDKIKASNLSNVKGYIPSPDSTLSSYSGICLDYASMAACMLRSLGIPTRIMVGNVEPGAIYHAWNEVYINGAWHSVIFDANEYMWNFMDTTFDASEPGISRNYSYYTIHIY